MSKQEIKYAKFKIPMEQYIKFRLIAASKGIQLTPVIQKSRRRIFKEA